MDKRLKKIIVATRREMESFARKHNGIGYGECYIHLGNYCAIVSYFLVMVGRNLGYHFTLVEGIAFEDIDRNEKIDSLQDQANHCWVEYGDQIIDLSAKQFNSSLKKVHIADVNDHNYFPLNRDNVVRKIMKDEWPDEQSPYSHIEELRNRAKKLTMSLA